MTILTTLPASTSRGPCSTLDPCGWYLQVLAGAPGTCTYTSCYGVAVGQVGGRASLLPAKHSQHSKEPELRGGGGAALRGVHRGHGGLHAWLALRPGAGC